MSTRTIILIGVIWTVMFTFASISGAVATPGNWEWWRVALIAWPIGLGSFALFFGISRMK